jgi:hypothetical protein
MLELFGTILKAGMLTNNARSQTISKNEKKN